MRPVKEVIDGPSELMKLVKLCTGQSQGKGGFMNDIQCLSHTKWDCKYDVVWIPKYGRKTLYDELRKNLGYAFHEFARPKENKVLEGH
jgi:putative transposase